MAADKTILLVDDSPTQRIEFCSILEKCSYNVEIAGDGMKALAYLKSTSSMPDLILSDIFMPNMNGFELCSNVKDMYPEIPFIILTSSSDEVNLKKAFTAGADEFLNKPFTQKEVQIRISNVLQKNQIEKQLRQTFFEFEQIFNTATIWMRIIDFDYNVIQINSSLAKVLKKDRSELIGKKCYDVFPGNQCNTFECPVKRILKERKTFECDAEKKCPDGVHRCILTVVPFTGSNGEIVGIMENFQDITSRKQLQKDLFIFRELIAGSNDSIFIINPENSKFIDVNQQSVRALGYTREELLTMSVLDIEAIVPDQHSWKTHIEEVRKKESLLLVREHKRKDGTTFPVEVSIKLTTFENKEYEIAIARDITERKQAEEKLKLNSEIMKNMGEGVYLISIDDGIIRYSNPKLESMFGYSSGEMIGKNVSIVNAHTDIRPEETVKEITEVLNKTGEWSGEVHNIKKDGTTFWCYANCSVFNHPDYGKVIVAVHTDITERKKAEEALKLFKKAADSSTDAIAMATPEGKHYYQNDAFTELFGLSIGETMANTDIPSTPYVDESESREIFAAIMSGKTWNGELKMLGKTQKELDIKLQAYSLKDDDNNIIGLVGVHTDITDRKSAEKKLIESEKRFRDISLSSGSWAWEIDRNGLFKYCSEGIFDILGYSADELMGKVAFDFMPTEEAERTRKIFNKLFKQKKPFIDEETISITKDGKQMFFLQNGSPVLDEKGEIICYRGTSKDITARKKIEENLRVVRERLSLALEGSNSGIWDWNIESGEVLFDKTWCSMIGYIQKELKPHVSTWENLLHPDDKNKTMEELNKHLKSQKYDYSVEFRMKTKKGDWNWILAKGKVSDRNKYGKPIRMLGTHIDINNRKNLEISLAKSEAQLQGLLDNSPDMIAHIDTDNTITWANKTVLDLFPDAINKTCIFTDSDTICKNCPIAEVLKTGKLKKGITTHKISNHSREQFWETIGVPLKDNLDNVTGVLKISRNSTERIVSEKKIRHINQKLEKLLFADPLTGLINRKPFMDLLDKSIGKCKREQLKLALLFIDIDGFKNINDIYGHKIGDEVLKSTATKIKNNIRKSDFVGRLGGDEFIICLNGIKTINGAIRIAQKINKDFTKKVKVDGYDLSVGVSIGISVYPEDGKNVTELMNSSDMAMYKSKKLRENSFRLYNDQLKKEMLFNQALKSALSRNEFKLNYQTIVDKNEQPYCVEALLRWKNPEFGSIMPSVFIPALEENRCIIEVGEWVFREVCKTLKQLNINEKRNILASVNISQYQMEDGEFVDRIKKVVKETQIDPKNILLEITENIQIKDIESMKKTISKLKDIGIGLIALDDFGTGYSSFSNLIRFPIDIVKIDNFFVERLNDKKYCNITSSLIKLIKEYNFKVIAEGIETLEQFELLKSMGCDYFQGFYFSKPKEKISL
jgi:diguanylate cyclase (GGDEF)-like protein/PAS domain S-box-containing protein